MSGLPSTWSALQQLLPDHEAPDWSHLRLASGHSWPVDLALDELWLLPGLVDLSCSLGEPGPPHPASIATELRAARRGGFQTVLLNPDCQPVVDQGAVIEWIERRAAGANGAELRLLGALTDGLQGQSLSNMDSLRRSGVNGLSQGLQPLPDVAVLRNALRYAAGLAMRVHLRPVLPGLDQGLVAESPQASAYGLAGIPVAAETAALGILMSLVEDTGCPCHLSRLSSAAGVAWVRWAKSRGLPVTADVSLAHLLLTSQALEGFANQALLDPPLRSEHDRQGLLEGLADGTIDAICSDHRPQPADQYQQPLASTPKGHSSFDSFLSLLWHAPELAELPLPTRLRAASLNPARIAGVAPRMHTLFAAERPRGGANASEWLSATRNSPYSRVALRGRCMGVIIDNEIQIFSQ
jgi:dihydroorotase